MALYRVQARKWENGWELQVDGAGQAWSPSLADAEARAREHIANSADVTESSVHIELVSQVDEDTDRLALEARRSVHNADKAMRVAEAKTREVVQRLNNVGLSSDDTSRYLELPAERIAELTAETGPAKPEESSLPQRRRRTT